MFGFVSHNAHTGPPTRSRTISRLMPLWPTSPALKLVAVVAVVMLAGCQPNSNPRAVPSVAQIGSGLRCASGDHGFADFQAGWGFCYPGTWKYNEHSQGSLVPPGLDLTFDITNVPCVAPAPGASASPVCTPAPPCVSPAPGLPSQAGCSNDAGLFAFMIISTYERGNASSLAGWELANLPRVPTSDPISWGNATEAERMSDGRRIALTPNHVVILDLHSGQGHLDLEAQMSTRLDTWKFTF